MLQDQATAIRPKTWTQRTMLLSSMRIGQSLTQRIPITWTSLRMREPLIIQQVSDWHADKCLDISNGRAWSLCAMMLGRGGGEAGAHVTALTLPCTMCRAAFDGDVGQMLKLLEPMPAAERLALDPQGNTVGPMSPLLPCPAMQRCTASFQFTCPAY